MPKHVAPEVTARCLSADGSRCRVASGELLLDQRVVITAGVQQRVTLSITMTGPIVDIEVRSPCAADAEDRESLVDR